MKEIQIAYKLHVKPETFKKLVQEGTELGHNHTDAGPQKIVERLIMWEGLSILHKHEPEWWIDLERIETPDTNK
jgi:hypothetical protein